MLEHMEDRAELGLNDWHFCVLLDVGPPLDPMGMNQRDLAGDTPLDMAYRLSRRELTGTLESLGALGDLQFRDWPSLGTFMPHDKYIHQPARFGNVKILHARHQLGGSLNDRDVLGNTPLHLLLTHGHLKAARYFITHYAKYGLDLYAKNSEGNTPRNIAQLHGEQALAQALLDAEINNSVRALRLWREMGLNHARATDAVP
ncbi:ankyrin repeat domain-containing protein [Pseudomonas sp. SWRI92]|uniref:Ankyrin repeat domain-containing protein n=1 Tax=Pseudomonas marvdashtae TaxID=2745500 RepID=A0A923FS16_9PSED|nr:MULTISPECIES: ankyrin repeat domain-containing protein [Pseudomonas]MBC3375947.1 ankyrin repeat domain-containing protein [Pseudomonas sp. SWRI92]MBV4550176.1 ankyrin repeat domain-containing protein [Pseudomonas marvdashtae]